MGMFDGVLRPSDLSIDTPELSEGGQGLIDAAYARSSQAPTPFVVGEKTKLPTPEQIANSQNTLGSSDKAMSKVISQRIGRSFNQGTEGLRNSQGLRQFDQNFSNQKTAGQYLEAAHRVKMRNAEMKMNVYRANMEARASALRSILGLGGMAAGMAIAGPPGAAMGSQLGGAAVPQGQQANSNIMGGYNVAGADFDSASSNAMTRRMKMDRWEA